ncbi:hypothetical protein [Streptococcus acidominimus]|nr:hypothetical protein [Streptococcus acidominimus]
MISMEAVAIRLAAFLYDEPVVHLGCKSVGVPVTGEPRVIPKPDYREVADENGLGRERFKSDSIHHEKG